MAYNQRILIDFRYRISANFQPAGATSGFAFVVRGWRITPTEKTVVHDNDVEASANADQWIQSINSDFRTHTTVISLPSNLGITHVVVTGQ